jgi:hypothetical protein
MAQLSIPQLPGGGRVPKGFFGIVTLAVVIVALFGLYLVSPFFTVGEYERTHVEGPSQYLHGRQSGAGCAGDAELPDRRG